MTRRIASSEIQKGSQRSGRGGWWYARLLYCFVFMGAVIHASGNTELQGAQLAGKTVKAEIGGDLLIETLQDEAKYESRQSSSGFDIIQLQGLESFAVGGLHLAKVLASRTDGGVADFVLLGGFCYRGSICFAQDRDHLLFTESTLPHGFLF
jgi:Hemagglutinin repeat